MIKNKNSISGKASWNLISASVFIFLSSLIPGAARAEDAPASCATPPPFEETSINKRMWAERCSRKVIQDYAVPPKVGKSVEDCEAEIGQPSVEARPRLLYKCLVEHLDLPPSAPKPERSRSVYVKNFGIYEVNSVGGVELYAVFTNPNTTVAIKYINMQLTLFNAVGDILRSDIGRTTTAGISFTGPLDHAAEERNAYWGPIWYNSTGHCVAIQSLSIEFMNGKRLSFAGKNLAAVLGPDIENDCRVKKP